jgi:glycosyltransferase involved in cell wall biosynthesis
MISVVIPSLGGDLDDTLDSVNAGSICPDEIIACLPNDTHSVKDAFKYKNLTIVYAKRYGQVYQRICGFKEAKYDYVLQLDDDVVVSYNCIELLVDFLNKTHVKSAISPCWYNVDTGKPLHQIRRSGLFMSFYYWLVNGLDGYRPGKVSLAGTNFGINPVEVEIDSLNLDWQPGGCVLHKKENLILNDFYPYGGKAYSEDLMHSFLLRQSGISLFVVMKATCMTNINQRILTRKEIISDFKARLYFVRMADLSMIRMLIYYMIYIMKSVILICAFKKSNLV